MVAAEQDIVLVVIDFGGDTLDIVHEVGRLHAGIPTELVNLVGGRLDQQDGTVLFGLKHGSFQHGGLGGTNGIDARPLSGAVVRQNLYKFFYCAH